ncbi:MAG TPA: hypothetical protein VNQ76_10260, partial [Planctomicrobium sp.]|nr:hypothetical protein [Planctomicrobium sp.]
SRVFSRLAASGGKLYLAGGFTQIDGHFAGATPIEVYDPETNTWGTVLEEFAPQLSKMTLLGYQDRLLFYSIDADQAGLAHFVLIDPAPQTDGYGPPANEGQDRSASQELAAQLRSLDKNGDGQIALDEVGERFQQLIKRIDTNGDGIASQEEISAFGKTLDEQNRPQPGAAGGGGGGPGASPAAGASPMTGPMTGAGRGRGPRGTPEERVTRFFEENDKDKDGVLKGEEVPERWRNDLEQIDTNKDGALDRAEVEARFRSFGRGRNGGRPGSGNPARTGQPSPQAEGPAS